MGSEGKRRVLEEERRARSVRKGLRDLYLLHVPGEGDQVPEVVIEELPRRLNNMFCVTF